MRKRYAGAAVMAAVLCAGMASSARAQAAPAQTAATDAKDMSGQWQGTVTPPNGPAQPQRIVFLVSKDAAGAYKAIFNYIDLIAAGNGIPRPANLTLQGSAVEIKVPGNNGNYRGQLSADGKSIAGSWDQGGPAMILNLTRTTAETAWDVPKPPPPPKPMAADADPSFEVATIKPSDPSKPGKFITVRGRNFATHNFSLAELIGFAYGVHAKQIVDAPDWVDKDTYDITAVPDGEGQPNDKQWKSMLKKLLTERFHLTFHPGKRELAVYTLTVAKDGPKNMTKEEDSGPLPGLFFRPAPGGIQLPAKNATMADFAGVMQSAVLDRPVVDQTGLTGRFDFTISWAPDESQFNGHAPPVSTSDNPPPGLFTAIQEQVGLKLEPVKIPADVMVIDKVEKPSAN